MKINKIIVTIVLSVIAYGISAQTVDILNANFASSCAVPPTGGWTIQNVDGTNCTWRCSGGMMQNNHTSQNCSGAANDWLITPALALDNYRNENLVLNTTTQYAGGGLAVKYSTNYPGTGDPSLYTWGTLVASVSAGSMNINLSGITGNSVYIGFQYTSSGNQTNEAAMWTITSVVIQGEISVSVENPSHRLITPTSAVIGAEIKSTGGLVITERGVLWSNIASIPTALTANTTKLTRNGGIGVYDTIATNLPPGTLIYYRGYARTADLQYFYSPVSSFYTLAEEPQQHATALTATTLSGNSIMLNWNAETTAKGYLILQKKNAAPLALPLDAQTYLAGSALGDAVVAAVITDGTVNADTIENLLTGTRYYFSLIPIGMNTAKTIATYNYLTAPTVPVANDSTWGAPASSGSDIVGIAGSESQTISTTQNIATISANSDGGQVWKLAFRDGGASLNDVDILPTVFTEFTIINGNYNNAAWQNMIRSVALFDDTTGNKIGTVTVTADGIKFSGLNMVAADNNFRTATLRLSLNTGVVLPENSLFQFAVRENYVKLQSPAFSSQAASFFSQSDITKNKIKVSATRLRIATQPATIVDAGISVNNVSVELVDDWNNLDVDSSLQISASSVSNNLNSNQTVTSANGKATFNNLIFKGATGVDTLVFESGSFIPAKSVRIKVRNALLSDVAATPSFTYSQNIPYISFLDSTNLTLSNSLALWGLTLRDGGASMNDADTARTQLNSLQLTVTNYNQIKTLALFDSAGNNLSEAKVNAATVNFSNINVVANDNSYHRLTLGATFQKTVTDGMPLQFQVTQVTMPNDTTASQFNSTNAGAAGSSPYQNKIEVVASKFELITQPATAFVNQEIYPSLKVRATDSLGNMDRNSRIINTQATKGSLNTNVQVAISPATGFADFNGIIFADTITETKLIFSDGNLSVTSDSFNAINSYSFRSLKTGSWDDVNTWEYSADAGQTWDSAIAIPDATKHGAITIREGHTVTMQGATKLDETIVEKNAILITPTFAAAQLEILDGRGEDLVIYGILKHQNGTVNGLMQQANSTVHVKTTGTIELAANGYAAAWAANDQIQFDDNATYYHNTAQTNSIGAANYFASLLTSDIPVFKIGANNQVNSMPNDSLIVNGVVSVDGLKTLTLSGLGNHIFRNGFSGNGNVVFNQKSRNTITGQSQIAGNGYINIDDSASLVFAASSITTLANNKIISSNHNNAIDLKGKFNAGTFVISGNAGIRLAAYSWLQTAHINGVKASLNVTKIEINPLANVELNGTTQQQRVNLPGNTQLAEIKISNLYGVVLEEALVVSKNINLVHGSITTAGNGVLIFNDGTTVLNYNIDRFINGKVRVSFNKNIFLPLGKNFTYAPLTIDNQYADSSIYEVEYFDTLVNATPVSGMLKRLLFSDSWNINKLQGTSAAKISLTHHATLQSGESLADLRLAAFNNSSFTAVEAFNRNAKAISIDANTSSASGLFALVVAQSCSIPAEPVVVSDTVCYGTSATLTVNGTNNYNWHATLNGNQTIYNGNNFTTASLYHDTVFFVETQDGLCASNRATVSVKVVEQLTTPLVPDASVRSCKNAPLTLAASGNDVIWFANSTLTLKAIEEDTFITGNLHNDTAFYVVSSKLGCLSESKKVLVILKDIPAKPFTSDINVCKGSTAVLAASSNASAINWYVNNSQATPIANGNYVSIQNITTDTALYAEALEGSCYSERVKVQVNMKPVPVVPVVTTSGVVCAGNPLTLNATSETNTISWYLSDADTVAVHTGDSYTTQALNSNTIFFVNATNGFCKSASLAFPVSVIEPPAVSKIQLPRVVKQFDSVAVVAENSHADEYIWNFGNDAEPSVAVGAGPHYVKWKTAGTHAVRLTVSNKLNVFACSKQIDTVINVTPTTGLNETNNVVSSLVYPNPASFFIQVKIQLKKDAAINLSLTDAVGKTVWTETYNNTNEVSTRVDVSNFQNGVYLLMIESEGSRTMQKLVIGK